MRSLLLFAFLFSSSLTAQNLQFYIDNSGGGLPTSQLAALPALFNFPDTPVGGSSTVMIRVLNAGSTASVVNTFYVGATAGSSVRNPNFTATSFVTGATLAPGTTRFFNLH